MNFLTSGIILYSFYQCICMDSDDDYESRVINEEHSEPPPPYEPTPQAFDPPPYEDSFQFFHPNTPNPQHHDPPPPYTPGPQSYSLLPTYEESQESRPPSYFSNIPGSSGYSGYGPGGNSDHYNPSSYAHSSAGYFQTGASGYTPSQPSTVQHLSDQFRSVDGTQLVDLETKSKCSSSYTLFSSHLVEFQGMIHKYTPKQGFGYKKITHNGDIVWETKDDVYATKVLVVGVGFSDKKITIEFINGTSITLKRKGSDKQWKPTRS